MGRLIVVVAAGIQGNFVDGNYDPFYNLLEAVLVSSELGYSDTNTPFAIVEEVMETVTIEDTEHIFDFIEQRSERLTDVGFETRGPSIGAGLDNR